MGIKLDKNVLSDLPNIGNEVARQLNKVGIYTYEELKRIGAKNAWLKIQSVDESACIHRLLALEGAIQGMKKTLLSNEVKDDLKAFYREHKK
ncbi:TfoX/Sxy family protein [Candidatus Galacturonibacter soehngenii]|uniref:TfoX/Sxy family protein n=1 Tax=Candidatus Galacturonatibacter soehngenii TaxID=2307010 RepID=A0A7V7QJM7_9FIRM|nr:TfoX/Sxy family protein [Candidatus Galacturonibacter soehngenii]KAB1437864.1 TfoX/Sxy family protein [Candidatus Galacturonibacter soehngenii]MBA4687363.1 TfoX/Sxy family protein [Candidatus Galacturonibacter soehngenii]